MALKKTVIVGSGLVGAVLASILARDGHDLEVFDRVSDPRAVTQNAGRSINLTLCRRGLDVLDEIGVGEAVRAISVPVYGRVIHDLQGRLTFQPYGNHREAIYSIARNNLKRTLLQFAETKLGVPFRFNWKCVDVDLESPAVALRNMLTGEVRTQSADWIFGADGVHSAVRARMQKNLRLNLSLQHWEQGYKEIAVPPCASGWTSQKNVIHIWPRSSYMLIGFPNIDGSFTCSLHLPFEGPLSFESIHGPDDLYRLFQESFRDAIDYMPEMAENFFHHPANAMTTVKCSPWSYRGRVAIIGDAAHCIYPSYGQGANAGFEDCAALGECIKDLGNDPDALLRRFEERRRPNTDAIADLCMDHFRELRDLVGAPRFLLRKQLERKINELHPADYQDLYSMISFTPVPYTEALQIDRERRAVVDQLMDVSGIEDKLESPELVGLIERLLSSRAPRQPATA